MPLRFLKAFHAFRLISHETTLCHEKVKIVNSELKESEEEILLRL